MIPDSHEDLLTRALYSHFASLRKDGSVQVNPTWHLYEDGVLLFTTSTARGKYHNVRRNPRVAISVNDPDQPYRYLEVRGEITEIRPDTSGAFFDRLAQRYGLPYEPPVADAADRVVLVMRPEHTTTQ